MQSNNNIAEQTEWIRTACLAEAAVPKLGNVHPTASFSDVTYTDFASLSRSCRLPGWLRRVHLSSWPGYSGSSPDHTRIHQDKHQSGDRPI